MAIFIALVTVVAASCKSSEPAAQVQDHDTAVTAAPQVPTPDVHEEAEQLQAIKRATRDALGDLGNAQAELEEARAMEADAARRCIDSFNEGEWDRLSAVQWQDATNQTDAALKSVTEAMDAAVALQRDEACLAHEIALKLDTDGQLREYMVKENGHTSAPPPTAFPTVTVGDARYSVIEVHYGTDRKPLDRDGQIQQYAAESDGLSFGVCHVSVPQSHKPGGDEKPWWWESGDPTEHILLLDAFTLTEAGFTNSLKNALNKASDKDILVVVHGFNVSFEEAARRTAQLTYDLGFRGVPAMYSWPSQASLLSYGADYDMAAFTSFRHLASYLSLLAAQADGARIHILAHSLGNIVLCRAIEELARSGASAPKFGHIIMAAPDVPAKAFIDDFASPICACAQRVTVYASSVDLALMVSEDVLRAGEPRLGSTGSSITVVQGIDMIVADDFRKGILFHSYYADVESIIHDLIALLRLGWAPDQRCMMRPDSGDRAGYWVCSRASRSECLQQLLSAIAASFQTP